MYCQPYAEYCRKLCTIPKGLQQSWKKFSEGDGVQWLSSRSHELVKNVSPRSENLGQIRHRSAKACVLWGRLINIAICFYNSSFNFLSRIGARKDWTLSNIKFKIYIRNCHLTKHLNSVGLIPQEYIVFHVRVDELVEHSIVCNY